MGALEDVLTTVAAGSGIRWSTEMHDWLGHGIYFWEDISWAEWWQAERWHMSQGVRSGAILAASIDADLLLDLSSRSDADFFREEASVALEAIQRRKNHPVNDNKNQLFYLDCAVVNSIQRSLADSGKQGLRMPFHLETSLTEDGNFFAGQHLQVCLWNIEALQDVIHISQPDRL
ncbi:MAG: hypothetical protein ACKO8I_07420 [Cyanobacteriota bacterium]